MYPLVIIDLTPANLVMPNHGKKGGKGSRLEM